MLRTGLLTTRSLSRPSAVRCASTAPRLQGPKDSTGEVQVRLGVKACTWMIDWVAFCVKHASQTAVQAAAPWGALLIC